MKKFKPEDIYDECLTLLFFLLMGIAVIKVFSILVFWAVRQLFG